MAFVGAENDTNHICHNPLLIASAITFLFSIAVTVIILFAIIMVVRAFAASIVLFI